MRRLLMISFFCAIACAGFSQSGGATPAKAVTVAYFPAASPYSNNRLSYKIIPSANSTWCYDIYANGKMMIHQPSVPGMSGNAGFKSKADAGKVAELVISKIKKGEMPPAVEIAEMKKLKVI